VELVVAPISGNFFSIQEQDHVWKFIKLKLKTSIELEYKKMGSTKGPSHAAYNSRLKKHLMSLLDPLVWRSTGAHDEEVIAKMTQALIVDSDGDCRVQLAVDTVIERLKDSVADDLDAPDHHTDLPNLHPLVNDCFDLVVMALAKEVGFMCSLYNPQDASLALRQPMWLYSLMPEDDSVEQADEVEVGVPATTSADIEIAALKEKMIAMEIAMERQMQAMQMNLIDEIRAGRT
jgi:hypothetical protein